MLVYCRILQMIDLFSHFSYEMGSSQYYPPGAPELSENRLFGMFHAKTPQHSKEVILGSLMDPGVVRVVFASVALGMGVDLKGVDTLWGTIERRRLFPVKWEGRGKRSGASARSIEYWKPSDCPRTKEPSTQHEHEVNEVRSFLENSSICRRKWLLSILTPKSAKPGAGRLASLMVQVHAFSVCMARSVWFYVTCRGHLSPEGSSGALALMLCDRGRAFREL